MNDEPHAPLPEDRLAEDRLPEDRLAEDRLAEYLDGDLPESVESGPDLTGIDPRVVADHLFLDGLLRRLALGNDDDVHARVQRAMASIDRYRRLSLIRIVSTAAAILMIALLVWNSTFEPKRALEAMVDRAVQQSEARITRVYNIESRRGDRKPLRARLYVYGVEQFMLHIEEIPALAMLGVPSEIRFGTDGKEWWMVPSPPLPVFVGPNEDDLKNAVKAFNLQVSFLQIAKMLPELKKNYRVTLKVGAPVGAWPRKHVREPRKIAYLEGELRNSNLHLPEKIELEADFFGGSVHRMVVTRQDRRTEIDLVDELDESEWALDWYHYDTHRDPSQRVIRWGN